MIQNDVIDIRSYGLRQAGEVVRAAATYHSGVDVDDTTAERWRQLMGLMREVDTLADTRGDRPIGFVMDYLTDTDSPFFTRYPALFPDQIDFESYQRLFKRARAIIRLGDIAAHTQDMDLFEAVRVREGELTANLLEDSATSYVREQPAFTDIFMPLARSSAVAVNMFDSLIDARRDYRQGRMAVKPDKKFYAYVTRTGIHNALQSSNVLRHPPVVGQLGLLVTRLTLNKIAYDKDGNPTLPLLRHQLS